MCRLSKNCSASPQLSHVHLQVLQRTGVTRKLSEQQSCQLPPPSHTCTLLHPHHAPFSQPPSCEIPKSHFHQVLQGMPCALALRV
jgi:hypothetical protein